MMPPPDPQALAVVGLGGCTAFSRRVRPSVAAARAGLSAFERHPFLVDVSGDPVVLAPAPYLESRLRAVARMEKLGVGAGDEALSVLRPIATQASVRVQCILVGPADRPGAPARWTVPMLERLGGRWGELLPVSSAESRLGGHSAGLGALAHAHRSLLSEPSCWWLIVAVDSYIDRAAIEWLGAIRALHSPSNPWGFVPGEGAGALLLTTAREATRCALPNRTKDIPNFLPNTGMVRRPDAVIVNDVNAPPTQGNLAAVVEIKFPPDTLDPEVEQDYKRIAGQSPLLSLSPERCGCPDPKKKPQEQPATDKPGALEVTLLALALIALVADDAVGGEADDIGIPAVLARLGQAFQ
jgi:hypothetical protein